MSTPSRRASVTRINMSSDKYKSKPTIDTNKLDFSEFHPLDHSVFECRNYPGGRRRHLEYRWNFQWRSSIRAVTLCRVGIHDPSQWWRRDTTWVGCMHCYKKLSKPQPL